MTTIHNYTPHRVVLLDDDNNIIKGYVSEGIARVSTEIIPEGYLGSVKFVSQKFGEVQGLPEEKNNVLYIVSSMVKAALPNRQDLVTPAELVRDSEGNVIGCRSLCI